MTTATRPVLSDRHRTVLAAVEAHGGTTAAGRALGLRPNAVTNTVWRAAAILGVESRHAIREARRRGLLDDAPTELPEPATTAAAREEVPRGDGTVWQSPKGGSTIRPYVEGDNLLILRTADLTRARRAAATRWKAMHRREVPATGQVVWRRLDPIRGAGGLLVVEHCEPGAPRSFPAVLFTPGGEQ